MTVLSIRFHAFLCLYRLLILLCPPCPPCAPHHRTIVFTICTPKHEKPKSKYRKPVTRHKNPTPKRQNTLWGQAKNKKNTWYTHQFLISFRKWHRSQGRSGSGSCSRRPRGRGDGGHHRDSSFSIPFIRHQIPGCGQFRRIDPSRPSSVALDVIPERLQVIFGLSRLFIPFQLSFWTGSKLNHVSTCENPIVNVTVSITQWVL